LLKFIKPLKLTFTAKINILERNVRSVQ